MPVPNSDTVAAASFDAPGLPGSHSPLIEYGPDVNGNVPPPPVYMPTPAGMNNGLGEAESLGAAQELGLLWIHASGYDGPYLPEPALTSELSPQPESTIDFHRIAIQARRNRVNTSGYVWLDDDMLNIYGYNDLLEQHNLELRTRGLQTTMLPPLPRIVGGYQYVQTDERILPSMGMFLGWTVGGLPELSQPYLANHLRIAHPHNRNGSADPVHRSPVHDNSPYLGVPFDWMYTERSLRKDRFFTSGPSNGFHSFGALTQADMPSPSLEHFSIMGYNHNVATAMRQQNHMNPPGADFNVFQELVKRPELVIIFAKHLRVQELLILYSMSKPFYHIVSSRITTVVMAQALIRAPDSARCFPFRCYEKLCIPDPGMRPHPIPERAMAGELRKVPSFRWLRMICYREMVCHEIMSIMAEDGVGIPAQCQPVLKKIWLLMDIPDNIRRIGLVQNSDIFTDDDLFFALVFFVKMDMRFTDPVTGSGRDGMRRLMMAQPGLTVFWRSLKRLTLRCKLDVVRLFVRWKHEPTAMEAGKTIFGIPPEQVGTLQYEGWGETGSRVLLQRPDELILMESLRRNLKLEESYTDMFLWGYVNPRTLRNLPIPIPRRRLPRLEGMEDILAQSQERANILKRVSTRVLTPKETP